MLVLSLSHVDDMLDAKFLKHIDCIEYRLDLMPCFPLERPPKPFILTLRHEQHGGAYKGRIDALCQEILAYCQYAPDYVDLDLRLPKSLFSKIRKNYPHIKIIGSYHQFEANINALQMYLHSDRDYDVLKLAMVCERAMDVLQLFQLKTNKPLALIPMGEKASFGRIIGKVLGNALDYVAPTPKHLTAKGQLALKDMIEIYGYHHLNSNTKIYALLANPVTHSVGHLYHNNCFRQNHQNAVYVKIEQEKSDLTAVLKLMLDFPFYGLSLSMPLKQSVIEQQVINTLVREDNRWLPYNTDGLAVIHLLQLKPFMRVLILGNGGAAKGIGEALDLQGFKPFYLARTGGDYQFEGVIPCFDVVINTLGQQAFLERPWFLKTLNRLITSSQKRLDVIYHEITCFQVLCQKANLSFISGKAMFEAQAELQQDLWKSN